MRKLMSISAVCPLWKAPSYKMEMISQLLFSEQAVILEEGKNFTHVHCMDDGYEGWCMNNQVAEVSDNAAFELKGYINKTGTVAEINNSIIHLPVATPVYIDLDLGAIKIRYPANDFLHKEDIKANESAKKL